MATDSFGPVCAGAFACEGFEAGLHGPVEGEAVHGAGRVALQGIVGQMRRQRGQPMAQPAHRPVLAERRVER